MLAVYRNWNIIGHNSAAATCAHDRNQNIPRINSVSFKSLIFFWRNESVFPPAKLISDNIVNTQHSDAFLYKLAMEKLASKWPSANRPFLDCGDLCDRRSCPAWLFCRRSESNKPSDEEVARVLKIFFGLGLGRGDGRKDLVQYPHDPSLFMKRGKRNFLRFQIAIGYRRITSSFLKPLHTAHKFLSEEPVKYEAVVNFRLCPKNEIPRAAHLPIKVFRHNGNTLQSWPNCCEKNVIGLHKPFCSTWSVFAF